VNQTVWYLFAPTVKERVEIGFVLGGHAVAHQRTVAGWLGVVEFVGFAFAAQFTEHPHSRPVVYTDFPFRGQTSQGCAILFGWRFYSRFVGAKRAKRRAAPVR
jgi:hypothetical protein